MKQKIAPIILVIISFVHISATPVNYTWGFFAHRKINRLAVFTIPEPLFGFYRAHIEEITKRAVNPDMRRHAFEDEPPKHYIDLDHYCEDREAVFDSIPKYWKEAVEKYTEEGLKKYGIIPWAVNQVFYQLVKAFETKNWDRVIKLSADLGHYIADAHVPLHTTENYNGQLTGQNGIHAFWESRLPELFSDEYNFFVGKSHYIENQQLYIWNKIKESHLALDSVLDFEMQLRNEESEIYSFETKGKSIVKGFSKEYSTLYHQKLDGMVERRMCSAILTIGSFWYTTWVRAGQPVLPDYVVIPKELNDTLKLSETKRFKPKREHE